MLKKVLMTGAAAAFLAAGAVALQPTPAEAGNFSVQLHFGSPGYHAGPVFYDRHRFHGGWGRHGYRNRCYTEYRPVAVRRPFGGSRIIWEPVRLCRW